MIMLILLLFVESCKLTNLEGDVDKGPLLMSCLHNDSSTYLICLAQYPNPTDFNLDVFSICPAPVQNTYLTNQVGI